MRELDTAIESKQQEVATLRKAASELPQAEADLTALLRVKQLLTGSSVTTTDTTMTSTHGGATPSIADATDMVLTGVPELHADDILKRLQQQFGIKTTKQTVVGTILRYMEQGKRFRKTGPNKFAKAV